MKSNIRKYGEFGALCLLAVAILWWFGRSLDWSEVREAVSHANPYLLALAALIISLSYLFRAVRWGALLAPLSPASLKNLFIATTVGFAAVFLVGRAGEVVRPAVLPMRDPRIRASASFVTILVERIYDLIAVAILFAANLLWFQPPANAAIEFGRVRVVGLMLLVATLLGVFGLTQYRKKSSRAIGWLKPRIEGRRFVPARLARAVISILEQLARALRVLVDTRELAITVGWTAVVWLSIGVASMLVFRAFDLPFGMSETIFVLGWALVGSLVPTPGGAAGAFHAATAAGLIFLDVPRETAAAVAIVLHMIDFCPAIVFGFIYLVKGDINISRLRSVTSSEAVEHAVEDDAIVSEEIFVVSELEPIVARD